MSYILDAIKKADQKRKLGEVPDVNTIHEAPMTEPRRFGWLYGLAAILFINAGGLAWWLWASAPGQEPVVQAPVKPAEVTGQQMPSLSSFQTTDLQTLPATPVATAPPALPLATPQGRTEKPPLLAQAEAPRPQSIAATIPTPARPLSLPGNGVPPANPAAFVPVQQEVPPSSLPEEQGQEVDGAVSDEESLMEAEGALPAEEQIDEPVASDQVLAPIAISSGSKEQRARKAKREEEDPELAKIPFLKQLPVEVQKSLPVLHISFHSYSIKPSARLVSISGKILRQGEEFDADLKLERITIKGVVLNFKGKIFRLEV